jgi:superfamily II DNA or RNA helicase
MSLSAIPEQGQLVRVRGRQWAVASVEGATAAAGGAAHHLVHLASVDDELGDELDVVWEVEPATDIADESALPDVASFDPPERLDAFLDSVRWGASSSADYRTLSAPFRAGIEIEDYQLDPVVRAVQMPRVGLLIADDVGLGKTIEAGLVALELFERHRANRMLIVCPADLLVKWRDEMRDKFGLEFHIVNSELLRQLRRTRGIHVNPWSHYPRIITSIDYLKRERPLRLMRETLPRAHESLYPRRIDLLIVDEAHNVAPSGRGQYAIDSLRTGAIRTIAPHAEHKLFLTATPHNGYSESFSALLELVDDQRFARGVKPDRQQLDTVLVRRLKSELPPDDLGRPRFPKRVIRAIELDVPPAEQAALDALRAYSAGLLRASGREGRLAAEFVAMILKKRFFSSPAAFGATLEVHRRSLGRASAAREAAAHAGFLFTEDEEADDEAFEERIEEAVDEASAIVGQAAPSGAVVLRELTAWADAATAQGDAKSKELVDWVERLVRPGGTWSRDRVIVFTEYRATLNWLFARFAAAGLTAAGRTSLLYGGMAGDDRERVKAAFQADPAESPVRILLATDAASEGIDLQNHCSRVVHYEIPWNPTRLEQRNGRVDRHGQRATEVEIFHFAPRGFEQRLAAEGDSVVAADDLEYLARVIRKVDRIREDLGNTGQVVADQISQAMLGGPRRLDPERGSERTAAARAALRFERDLRGRITRAVEQLEETRRAQMLSPDRVERVVRVALGLARQPALEPCREGGVDAFRIPRLEGAWARCSDGLAHPFTGTLRPVVFDADLARARDDLVLAHLNHRLVQMSLGLLRAEIWAPAGHGRIARVAARIIPNSASSHPIVVAYGRLVVIGGTSRRLHEELVIAGGEIKAGRFVKGTAQSLVTAALAAATDRMPTDAVLDRLRAIWPSLHEPLEALLGERAERIAARRIAELEVRSAKESADIRHVLDELRESIRKELEAMAVDQPYLPSLEPEEHEQRERNHDALRRKFEAIPEECAHEQAALEARYADPRSRLFSAALVFLVPERYAEEGL